MDSGRLVVLPSTDAIVNPEDTLGTSKRRVASSKPQLPLTGHRRKARGKSESIKHARCLTRTTDGESTVTQLPTHLYCELFNWVLTGKSGGKQW